MKFTVSLKQNHVFRRLYAKGKNQVTPHLALYARKNGGKVSRLGITASTKLGHAVVRNRVRRRLREIYRIHEDQFLPGYDIVAVARVRRFTPVLMSWSAPFSKRPVVWGCCAQKGWIYEADPAVADRFLPQGHFSFDTTVLPVYSHLFAICHAGD